MIGMTDITRWLDEIGLAKYADAFRSNDIDFDVLPELGAEELKTCPGLVERISSIGVHFFELSRACEVEGGIAPDGIVKPVDVAANGLVASWRV